MNLEQMRLELLKSGNYKIQVKQRYKTVYNENKTNKQLKKAVALDTETTGLDYKKDEIFNISLFKFTYDETGKIYEITDSYTGFQETNKIIPVEVESITGVNQSKIIGKKFEMEKIERIMSDADIVIAHNATFDRGFVDKLVPQFKNKTWCDSQTQIPWSSLGVRSAKLGNIANRFDFFFDEHLASSDTLAVIEILSKKVNGKQMLLYLLDTVRDDLVLVKANDSPFETKDLLKFYNYNWNSGAKVWSKVIFPESLDEEKKFLQERIYINRPNKMSTDKVTRVDLFKS